ncbi:PAS domain-containing protein [Desulfosporosinus sp. BICA1-9]|uniref:PAS domain-containing protein n=1 Tax=Desulfosporosinus sp. BICA1-9 TaxID=1531958 RepID=UPI00054C2AC3|nr:PAS domain-containing protein [Desulfosporosinus sp. BICA1-9]KJS80761.1 MAG: hypothetical protein JL57_27585 [Desulfosporosinus sp. BICA1-9]HBW35877.1 hypothetical protein [Desulfosporosinus sp.]
MTFSNKLIYLMNLTGTTNSKLAKSLCVDPSLVWRWRKGTRCPLNNHEIMVALGNYFAGHLTMEYQKKEFHILMGLDLSKYDINQMIYPELLTLWLREDEYCSAIAEHRSIKQTYWQVESCYQAMSSLFESYRASGGASSLSLLIDEPFEKAKRIMESFLHVASRFATIFKSLKSFRIVLRQDVPPSYLQSLISTTSTTCCEIQKRIEWFYFPYSQNMFEHFFLIFENVGAVVSSAFLSENVSVSTVSKKVTLHRIIEDFNLLLKICDIIPADLIYDEEQYLNNPLAFINRQLLHAFNVGLFESLRTLSGEFQYDEVKFGRIFDYNDSFMFNYNALFIADSKGITQRVKGACEDLWGMRPTDMVGLSAFEMELNGNYYPSATRLVLENHKQICTFQSTKTGRNLLVLGTPIIDRSGNITHVVNLTRDITEQNILSKTM